MKNLRNILISFGIIAFMSFSCEEDKNIDSTDKQLIGSWCELEPCNDGFCDTITFNKDNTIGLYYPLEGYSYELITKDSLIITNELGFVMGNRFTFIETDILLIYNFIDRSITNEVKNIKFSKL
jgi:hypothetical protein